MLNADLRVADDSDPLTAGDWADLWTRLVANGCTCTLSGTPAPLEGAKTPELILVITLSGMAASRFVSVLVRFYEARRRARITLKQGDLEWKFENMNVEEFERSVRAAAEAISDSASPPGQ
jgi:hypothetical protein